LLRRIRDLISSPFARPPGRQSVWVRLAPEWCALAVYLVLFLYPPDHHATGPWIYPWAYQWWPGMLYAYLCAGTLLLVVPVLIMAGAFAGERARGTADALALTTADRSALVWGRFLHLATPWLRFVLWLLPLYLLHAVFIGFSFPGLGDCMAYAAGPKGLSCACLLMIDDDMYRWVSGWSWHALPAVAPRAINDAIQLFACLSVACYVGIRAKTTRSALIAAVLIVPVAAATVLAPAEWTFFLVGKLMEVLSINIPTSYYVDLGTLGLLFLAGFAFKLWLARRLLGRAAANFDAWMLGEKPGDKKDEA
jgi:hypothetical protein